MPEREIYYGPSSGLPELRALVGRFWTSAYGLRDCEELPGDGLGPEHVAIVSGATEGVAPEPTSIGTATPSPACTVNRTPQLAASGSHHRSVTNQEGR